MCLLNSNWAEPANGAVNASKESLRKVIFSILLDCRFIEDNNINEKKGSFLYVSYIYS